MNRIVQVLCLSLFAGLSVSLITGPEVSAEEEPQSKPQLKLMNLLRTELEVTEGVEVIVSLVEIPPESALPKHYHPGEEFIYVLEGSVIGWLKGKEDVRLKQGEVFKVPFKQVHTGMTEKEGTKLLVFRVHKKGEPERILSE